MTGVKEVSEVSVARMGPADILVFQTEYKLSTEAYEGFRDRLCKVLPEGTNILILTDGVTVSVLRRDGA